MNCSFIFGFNLSVSGAESSPLTSPKRFNIAVWTEDTKFNQQKTFSNYIPAATISRFGRRHLWIEAGKPTDDFLARKRRIADLAMLLRPLARGEDPRSDGMRADELAHRPVEPVNVE
jgi:hypothetical protein